MTEGPDNPDGADWRRVWLLAAAVLAASVWAQLFWYPAATELLSSSPSLPYLSAYGLPPLVLAGALFVGGRVGTLFAVPMAFLPGLVVLPEPDVTGLLEPWRIGAAGATFAAYLAVAALAGREERADVETVDESEDRERVDGLYRHYFSVRVAVLAGLFAVMVGTPIFDASLLERVARHHAENRRVARAFLLLFGFFTWSVVAYMMFFSSAANLEYDVRRVRHRLDALVDEGEATRWRLAAWTAAGVGLALTAVLAPGFWS